MSEFKVGDKVRCKEGHYTGYTLGSKYNLPRETGIVEECGEGYLYVKYNPLVSPACNPNSFELVTTPIPLYSEEQAVSFLKEKGYSVTPPPEPLKGQIRIMKSKDGTVFYAQSQQRFDTCKLIAIVDWTEGDGV